MTDLVLRDNEIFELQDRKRLGYAVYGDPIGQPVLFFHGIPGSRLQRNPDLSLLIELSICVYAIDRPGTGLSSYQKDRSLLDWPEDVRAFCDGLGIERFDCIGISSGGPYALACAFRLPDRIRNVAIVSSLSPLDRSELFAQLNPRMKRLFRLAHRHPVMLNKLAGLLFWIFRSRFDRAFEYLVADLPSADKILLTQPAIAEMFKNDVGQAFRQGSRGVVSDMSILCKPWGFDLEEIQFPVQIWHGTADTIVPLPLARFNLEHLPHAQAHFIEGAGHFMALTRTREIFSEILSIR
ncbi:MAG: alpha/beta hydrolase [candidate division KSB1 bacterium]|nr:alpha/beta hydrolase [candidate division KSB1 bacterium]MDZ7335172.1 alpha/beta hydrolase [candidate division KSB1 bacterium]MDZ7356855.1 alpha/beta hydrolase [candidate division KSB1 bacterium]MDZ7375008.1 alpha/beta hydrolase [candidate division KSB1 bacterium]MDZ7401306.1 alpha/beta hydrolase [candidate division KSB1 bacterium]